MNAHKPLIDDARSWQVHVKDPFGGHQSHRGRCGICHRECVKTFSPKLGDALSPWRHLPSRNT